MTMFHAEVNSTNYAPHIKELTLGLNCINSNIEGDIETLHLNSINYSNAYGGIYYHSFKNIKNLEIGNQVESIPDGFSSNGHFLELDIPDNVVTIGADSLTTNNNLVKLRLGKGLKSIGVNAFSAVWELINESEIEFTGDEENGYRGPGFEYQFVSYLVDSISKSKMDYHDYCYIHNETDLIKAIYHGDEFVVPDGVKEIYWEAFADYNDDSIVFKNVYIPLSVTMIYNLDYGTKIEEITYEGTKSQWLALRTRVGSDSLEGVEGLQVVHCSDGDIYEN